MKKRIKLIYRITITLWIWTTLMWFYYNGFVFFVAK